MVKRSQRYFLTFLKKKKSAHFADFLTKSQQKLAESEKKKVSKIEFEITSTISTALNQIYGKSTRVLLP
jgi:hypothetical protein